MPSLACPTIKHTDTVLTLRRVSVHQITVEETRVVVETTMALIPCKGKTLFALVRFSLYSKIGSGGQTESQLSFIVM
jgi:hypothetical protein